MPNPKVEQTRTTLREWLVKATKTDVPCDFCGYPANLPTLDAGEGWRTHPGAVYDFGAVKGHRRCYEAWFSRTKEARDNA